MIAMIELDGEPLPAGHMDLVEAFDELRKRKRGERPWWEQEVPNDEAEQAAWTVRINSEWDEDVADLTQAFVAGDLVALVYSPRLRGPAQITRSEWANCTHPDELFLARVITGFMNSSMKKYIGHTPYISAISYSNWLKSKYSGQPIPMQPVRQSSSISKPRYYWQDFDNEAFDILGERGIPNSRLEPAWTQAALERLMIDWCESNWGSAPSESLIRKHVRDVINRFKLQPGSPA
jgi:hypothetical protein